MGGMMKRMAQASLLLALAVQVAHGQSLADLSRQERAKKTSKTTKEYTNDNLPRATLADAAPAAAAEAAKPAEAAKGDEQPGEKKGEKSAAEIEKEYRDKAAKLAENVAFEERRLDVLQRDLNLTQQQYYSDPNVALREQYSRADINKRTAEIEAQKATVEKAKQAVTDLEEELRKKSLPAGWARP